jgi:hypothetical protein
VNCERQQDEAGFQDTESWHSVHSPEDRCEPAGPAEREGIDREVHDQKPTER